MTQQQQQAPPQASSPSSDHGGDALAEVQARVQASIAKISEKAPAEPSKEPEKPKEKPPEGSKEPEAEETKTRDDKGKFAPPEMTTKTMMAHLTKNPEALSAMAKALGVEEGETEFKSRFVRIDKKREKFNKFQSEETTRLTELEAKITKQAKEGQEAIDAAILQVKPGQELLQALASEDFATVDAAFTRAGVSYDDWTKKRMRAGTESVRKSAESLLVKELRAELEAAKNPSKKEKKDESTPAKEETPAYSVATIEAEVDEDHAVREVANWEKKIQAATGDEDDEVSIEDAADKVLRAARKKMGFKEDDTEPAKKAKVEDEPEDTFGVDDFDARLAKARKRAGR